MQKKLLALAVAGVFAAPALVYAQSTVNIYGRMNMHFENVRAGGATNPAQNVSSRNRVSNYGGTSIGFRGSEKLGGGLSAIFQIESNATPAANNSISSRNSGVGLRGNFGTVIFGHWDTPYKQTLSRASETGLTALPGITSIIGNGNATGGQVGGAGQHSLRQSRAVYYVSPNFNGFEVKGLYGSNAAKDTPVVGNNYHVWSFSAGFSQGPLSVLGGFQRLNDWGGPGLDSDAWSIGGQFTFMGSTRVGAMYERLEYETGPAADTKRNAWLVNVNHRMGPHTIIGSFTHASDAKGNGAAVNMIGAPGIGATGAKQYTAQYRYSFSKRTAFVVSATQLRNDTNALYNLQGGGNGILGGAGADPKGFGVGFDHRF
jgi:predicted porin